MAPENLQQLLDIEAIKQLKARYCRFVDLKQWDRLLGLFTTETRFDGLGSAPPGSDAKTFVAGIATRLATVISIHHCHMPEIVFNGPDEARGIWSMMDYLEFPEGQRPKEAPDSRGFIGYGYYEEIYRRHGTEWKIHYLRLARMRVDALPADHPMPRPGMFKPDPGWI